jgi:hypothetical protein
MSLSYTTPLDDTAQDGHQLHCTVSDASNIGNTFAASLRTDICP